MSIRIVIPVLVLISLLVVLSASVASAQRLEVKSCEEEANDPYSLNYGILNCVEVTETPTPIPGQIPVLSLGMEDPCAPGSPAGALVRCVEPELRPTPTETPDQECSHDCYALGTINSDFKCLLSCYLSPEMTSAIDREVKELTEMSVDMGVGVALVYANPTVGIIAVVGSEVAEHVLGIDTSPGKIVVELVFDEGIDYSPYIAAGGYYFEEPLKATDGTEPIDITDETVVKVTVSEKKVEREFEFAPPSNSPSAPPAPPTGVNGSDPDNPFDSVPPITLEPEEFEAGYFTPIDPEMALTILPNMDHLHEPCFEHLIYPVPPELEPEYTESEFRISPRTGLPIISLDVAPPTSGLISSVTESSSSLESTLTMIERATSLSHPNASSITVYPGPALCSESGVQAAQQALDQAMHDASSYFASTEFYESVVKEVTVALGDRLTQCTCARNTHLSESQVGL